MKEASVICVGTAVLDQVFALDVMPERPTKVYATAYTEVGGGPAANAAVTIARLGGQASMWGRVGSDPVGERILGGLLEEGVDVRGMSRVEGCRSGVSAIMVDGKGERLIVNYTDPKLYAGEAALDLAPIASAGAVLGNLRWPEGVRKAFSAAREAGVPAVIDADVTQHRAGPSVYQLASHVVFARDALVAYAETPDFETGLRRAAERSGAWVAVTAGGDGTYWLGGGQLQHHPGFHVRVVDTLAAGDVFHGAFAYGLAQGLTEAGAIELAAATAAIKCTRFGGREGIPRGAEVQRFLERERAPVA